MNIASHRRLAEGRRALVSRPYRWLICLPLLIGGCATHPRDEPYSGPVAKPQVAYRIDDHRFFEVVPRQDIPCARARLYYTDTAKGIHTNVVAWDKLNGYDEFIIDAANDQYLVAPIVRSSSGCQTGGGDLCTASVYFSQDAGKTWISDIARGGGSVTYLTGETLYHQLPGHYWRGQKASLNVSIPNGPHWEVLPGGSLKRHPILNWVQFENGNIPPPIKRPLDSRLHCNPQAKE